MRFFNETTMSTHAKMPNVLILIHLSFAWMKFFVCPEFYGAEVYFETKRMRS